jgi:hypothetical protein
LVRAYSALSPDDDAAGRERLAARVKAWARVAQGAWIAWVVNGDDLGPRPAVWRHWAERAAVDLMAAHRRHEVENLTRTLDA